MRKRERYKRLIMFLASVLIVAIQTGAFAYAWFHDYHVKEIMEEGTDIGATGL